LAGICLKNSGAVEACFYWGIRGIQVFRDGVLMVNSW
jgi:hypothetical protein